MNGMPAHSSPRPFSCCRVGGQFKRWWPLVLHSTCRRVRDFSSRADAHVCFDLNPCWNAAAQLRGQVSARHTKTASLCHGSRSAALLPDAFCHQSHHG
ncbi:hypothetical protein V8C43DRAFT_286908 [Trichoderma afarasin]